MSTGTTARWARRFSIASFAIGIHVALPLAAQESAQPPTKPALQEITLADLEGLVIDATVVMLRDVETNVSKGQQRATHVWQFRFSAGGEVQYSQSITIVKLAKNESDTRGHRAKSVIGKPHEFRDGQAVLVFEDGKLSLLRTQAEGGGLVEISLLRASSGIGCKFTQAMARENGTGSLATTSTNFGVKWVKFLNSREVSNSCRATRKVS